ncbi:lysozyme inhibitor LprI family protein [Ralstonia soli]|uniref:Lysozyme inhibitor LprI family protein n=1 Tax=Ralstonia soli TaxID=2953896 RepID=A0ABT1ATF3_9RALS|nr:lysozyme inhibitor LprI family protein [Ralstonia soli]MCO5401501.1 lysozyme inhibitor LprI family protein [Ralstonia soli]
MMRRACAVALVTMAAMMTSLPAMAGTLEACRAAQPEARDVARCVQAARKAAQAELATAESARRNDLRARIAARGTNMDRGAAMAFDRTVRAHQLYRQAECDLQRRVARNTADADLAEAACDADLSRERIGALHESAHSAAAPATPAAAPAAPN